MKRSSSDGKKKQKRRRTDSASDKYPDIFKGKSLFIKMTKEAGLFLMDGSSPNILNSDQNLFLKEFVKILKRHDDYPEIVEDVIEGFEKYIEDEGCFVRAMLTTNFTKDGDNDLAQNTLQDAMIRLMLKTRPLQSGIAFSIIKKLENYKENNLIDIGGLSGSQDEPINVPQLIVNQLRWLDALDKVHSIAEKLLDIATITNYQTACGIITGLPEIITDDIHDEVALRLAKLLSSNVELAIAILDTLCSLNCSKKVMAEVERAVFPCLHSVKIEEMPVVVKYLLRTMNTENAESSINCLREHLTFSPSNLSQCSESSGNKRNQAEKTSVRLTAEAILSAIKFQSSVAESWIKLLKNLPTEEFTSTDFVTLVLLCTNCNSNQKKLAFSLAKSKLHPHKISETLLYSTFEDCSHVLIPYFATLSDLAGTCIRSNDPSLRQMGAVLYTCMFANLDAFCRQEVVGCLVQHVGSSRVTEMDTALTTMRALAARHLPLLMPFTLFVKGLLDHVSHLSCHQVKLVYEILSRLAFGCCDGKAPAIQNDLHMVIRKQLTHTSPKYRYIGIIGAMNILSVLGTKENCDDEGYKTAVSILKLLEETTLRNNKMRACYFDEISNLLCDDFDSRLGERLYKTFCKEFEDKFAALLGTSSKSSTQACHVAKFAIQVESQKKIPILPAVKMSDSRHELLAPLLRAMHTFNDADNSKLQELMLGPVLLHSALSVDDFKILCLADQKIVLDSLFVAMNWFREHISVLAKAESLRSHALERIDHILKIEGVIEALLPLTHNYQPPIAIPNLNETGFPGGPVLNDSAASGSGTQERGDLCEDDSGSTTTDSPDQTARKGAKAGIKKADVAFSIKDLKPQFFRELDVDAFDLIKLSMGEDLFRKEVTVNIDTDSEIPPQLMPRQLYFLLCDLRKKVSNKLLASNKEKRTSPFSTASNTGYERLDGISEELFGRQVCDLVAHLCNHLEAVSVHFQEDEDNDSEDLDIEKRQLLISCYEKLAEILAITLSWRGLVGDEKLRQTVLVTLGRRISPDIGSSRKEILKSAFSYMKNFMPTVKRVSLPAAATLAKLLSTLTSMETDVGQCFTSEMKGFTEAMLQTNWSNSGFQAAGTTTKRNEMLKVILRLHLDYSDDVLKTVNYFVDGVLCKIASGESGSEYPSFQRSNVHLLYSNLLEVLADFTSKIPGMNSRDGESAGMDLLLRWNDCLRTFSLFIELLTKIPQRNNIVQSLKFGRVIIENFVKNGMPMCEKMFHRCQDDVLGVLKSLQISTRPLQYFTCHSKVTKDTTLAKQVPPLKKCLESLLFRVKAMLALHNCQEAFWLGNLKNRNLKGEEILSQVDPPGDSQDTTDITNEGMDMSYSESY